MANVNRPSGLSPVRSIVSPWSGQSNLYWIPSTDTIQYNIGDAVQTGGSSDANGVAQIVKPTGAFTAGNLRGVIVGFTINPNNLTVLNAPATKTQDYYAWVVDDPNAIFAITDDGITTGNLVSTSINLNSGFTVANPTAPSPVSATVLTSASFAVTSTLPLKLLGLDRRLNNSFGQYASWLVKINNHELNAAGTAGN